MIEMQRYQEALENGVQSIIESSTIHTPDATIVCVKAEVGGLDYVVVGTSKRDPVDNYNPQIGVELALGRAVRQLGREILKNANGAIRQADQARLKRAEGQQKASRLKEIRRQERRESLISSV